MILSTLVIAATLLQSSSFHGDTSLLKLPPGATTAVVMFVDLECPHCATAYPAVVKAASEAHVPLVLYDFPLVNTHPWAFDAAVDARFFDTKSPRIGNAFRSFVMRNLSGISLSNLTLFVKKFARANHVRLPRHLDRQGKLKALVTGDMKFSHDVGVEEVPMMFVIGKGAPMALMGEARTADLPATIETMKKAP